MMTSAVAFAVLMAVAPYAMLREHRRAYAVVDTISYSFLAALWSAGVFLGVQLDPSLLFALFVVGKLVTFGTFLIWRDIIPSANWLGGFAGALYLVLVPHVLQWPVDGDEPYYLLVTESIVRDGDLDLRNQYADLGRSATRRSDLKPQMGDPVGAHGEQYSRTEPFLSLLLIPGYLAFGLAGAVGTIAIFGGLLIRSMVLLLEESGVAARNARIAVTFLAFAPPVLFYATRIWPEVPGAFFLVEALRAIVSRRPSRFLAAIIALSLLKLRFILIAAVLIILFARRLRSRWQTVAIAAALVLVPLLVGFILTGGLFNVHGLWELLPQNAGRYVRGFFGLLLDAQSGILFQAPFLLLGIAALFRWREVPPAGRIGALSFLVYLVLLLPRDEWHGGWSPPLRYIAIAAPVLALAATAILDRVGSAILALIGTVSALLVIHGLAFPWRLFHIANGESVVGEALSSRYHADFSRLLPSFVRPNRAAWIAVALLMIITVVIFFARRIPALAVGPILALAVSAGFVFGLQPGRLVHFEDSHVNHRGGELYPHEYTVARFRFVGGWRLNAGDGLQFRYGGGPSTLTYACATPIVLEVDGKKHVAPLTGASFGTLDLMISRSAVHTLRCLSGEVIIDRIEQR